MSLRESIDAAVVGTIVHDPASVAGIAIPADRAGAPEVSGESTFEALQRLAGAQAQEESLARSSALYPCLLTRRYDPSGSPDRARAPQVLAGVFRFRGAFDQVVFAVLDHRPGAPTRAAFVARFTS